MAKQNNIIRLSGTLDGITFYQRNGRWFARKKSSLNKERFKSDPAFARSRENNLEFAGAANIVRVMKKQVMPWWKEFADGMVHPRWTGMIRNMIKEGPGKRGMRDFLPIPNAGMMEGFSLNLDKRPLPFDIREGSLRLGSQRQTLSMEVTPRRMSPPKGSTHLEVLVRAIYLPAFQADPDGQKYLPVSAADLDGIVELTSGPMKLSGLPTALKMNLAFSSAAMPHPDTAIVVFGAARYWQEINQQQYQLEEGKAMRILRVL